MEATLPPGYKFNPTDQELIWHYLYKKVNGRPLPCNAIIDCDIYGGDSSWRKMFDDREEESLYFFTKLRNWGTQKNGCSSRVMRATKFGTWRVQSDLEIYAGKKHVGSKRTFSFIEKKKEEEEPKKKGSRKTNGWTMHEYRLDGCLIHQSEHSSSDYGYVVSRISRPRSMRRDEEESISSQIASELEAPFPEELNQDNNKGKSISSEIECEGDALFLEELNQNNKVVDTEMLPGYSVELEIIDEWFSCVLGKTEQDDFSFPGNKLEKFTLCMFGWEEN